jgi:hypothetical protein
MELNAQTQVQAKQFASKLRAILNKIENGGFQIDGTGDTLRAFVGMTVTTLGTDAYEEAREAIEAAVGEQAQVVALMKSIVARIDGLNSMNDHTLSLAEKLGITGGIKWV